MATKLVKALIGDNQEKVYTYGLKNAFEGVSIKVRPATPLEGYNYLSVTTSDAFGQAVDFVTSHVVGWNIEAVDGSGVAPADRKTVAMLPFPLLSWMADCIIGYSVPSSDGESEGQSDAKN